MENPPTRRIFPHIYQVSPLYKNVCEVFDNFDTCLLRSMQPSESRSPRSFVSEKSLSSPVLEFHHSPAVSPTKRGVLTPSRIWEKVKEVGSILNPSAEPQLPPAALASGDCSDDDEEMIKRMTSKEFQQLFNTSVFSGAFGTENESVTNRVIRTEIKRAESENKVNKKGSLVGVFIPTCENMWGVLIFLRFYYIVGNGGVGHAVIVVFLSFFCALCTVIALSATASSGGVVSEGGPYYMISRALGPYIGASVGILYFFGIVFLAVLEALGAVEALLVAYPALDFNWAPAAYGIGLVTALSSVVFVGINFVSKLGIFFIMVVFLTLAMFYVGLIASPMEQQVSDLRPEISAQITGLKWDTLVHNWNWPEARPGSTPVEFGDILAVFFPCFTGILSGANRADVLRDPPKNIRRGTFGAIIFSFFMYMSFMFLWGSVAQYEYLRGDHLHPQEAHGRRLAGGDVNSEPINHIVWNPSKVAWFGIMLASISQALQCMIVAPRLLQAIADDHLVPFLEKIANPPESTKKDGVRALLVTYILASVLCLFRSLDMIAPLLTMCFLTCYTFMNISSATLSFLKAPSWRPHGIFQKRWRVFYVCSGILGAGLCLTVMYNITGL